MTDIVERLKTNRCAENAGCGVMRSCACADMDDAADEITRLRAENERLRKRERAADNLLTEIEDYFDQYADGDEDGPNREAGLMAMCTDWLGPVVPRNRAALSDTENSND